MRAIDKIQQSLKIMGKGLPKMRPPRAEKGVSEVNIDEAEAMAEEEALGEVSEE